jgi:anti-anti-sigma regulatory factor
MGYSDEELSQLNAMNTIAAEARDVVAAKIEEVFTVGQAATETLLLTQSGDKIPYYFTGFRLKMGDEMYLVGTGLDLSAQKQAEAERERLQQQIIEAQKQTIQEISTPVIPVLKTQQGGIIIMPLVGAIDSMRARDVTRSLLAGISKHKARIVILDVTGVSLMDTGIVNHLNKTIQAAQLKGAQTIITGISDVVAESIVDLGIDWSGVTTLSDLQSGLLVALKRVGLNLK